MGMILTMPIDRLAPPLRRAIQVRCSSLLQRQAPPISKKDTLGMPLSLRPKWACPAPDAESEPGSCRASGMLGGVNNHFFHLTHRTDSQGSRTLRRRSTASEPRLPRSAKDLFH